MIVTALLLLALALPAAAQSLVDVTAQGTPVARVMSPTGTGARSLAILRDGIRPAVGSTNSATQYDTYDGQNQAAEDWIGYTFPAPVTIARVEFQEGKHFVDGGWFDTLLVQVRQGGVWTLVPYTVTPPYPRNNGVNCETFFLDVPPTVGDGVRLFGAPGGSFDFVSVAELRVYASGDGATTTTGAPTTSTTTTRPSATTTTSTTSTTTTTRPASTTTTTLGPMLTLAVRWFPSATGPAPSRYELSECPGVCPVGGLGWTRIAAFSAAPSCATSPCLARTLRASPASGNSLYSYVLVAWTALDESGPPSNVLTKDLLAPTATPTAPSGVTIEVEP